MFNKSIRRGRVPRAGPYRHGGRDSIVFRLKIRMFNNVLYQLRYLDIESDTVVLCAHSASWITVFRFFICMFDAAFLRQTIFIMPLIIYSFLVISFKGKMFIILWWRKTRELFIVYHLNLCFILLGRDC